MILSCCWWFTWRLLWRLQFHKPYWVHCNSAPLNIGQHHPDRSHGGGETADQGGAGGVGAIRDVLLDSNQSTYVEIYRQADRPQRQLMAKNQILGTFRRYALQALGMVAIALLGGLLVLQQGAGGAVIPLLGVLALGAQRLLPALQQVYAKWSSLKGFNANLAGVLAMLNQPLPPQVNVSEPLPLREGIHLAGALFRYGPEQPEVLQGLDLEIRRGERPGGRRLPMCRRLSTWPIARLLGTSPMVLPASRSTWPA